MKRLLVLLNGAEVPQMKRLIELEKMYDELIVVLIWRDFCYCIDNRTKPGFILTQVKKYFEDICEKNLYVFALNAENLSDSQLLMRIKHYSPSFDYIVSSNTVLNQYASFILSIPADTDSFISMPEQKIINTKRGLFLTRAQLFHNGHKEIIKSIMHKNDEIILVIACAEKAFDQRNPATAGERMSIAKAYLNVTYPNKHWIIPVAYNPFIAENFKELMLLLPSFDCFFSTNEIAIEMAHYDDIPVEIPNIKTNVRGSELRKMIALKKSVYNMMPKESLSEMKRLNIDRRIIKLYNN